ncbi:unnamed protein product [Lymnaea stagnalis]|uniref:Calponin-homology (CH) domain-containing protein n=1 Tax=Lymnaea stagnalis TaxID=6523 RepID=A0AAV2HAT0_LYMST
MSVLEIYINWVKSVLAEAGCQIEGVESVQDGKVLCEIIDVLAPSAGLVAKVKTTGHCSPLAYITAALEHMQRHGIRIKFPAEDIVNNEIKSMLDILWILILNYGIHYIGQNAFQRSVGTGKKTLLEWCMEQLGTSFDSGKSLSDNLCKGDWFVKLLANVAGSNSLKPENVRDKIEYIDSLLAEIEVRYDIKKDIIRASDIVDGIVDEHTLMIYLSLLKRRCSNLEKNGRKVSHGRNAALARVQFAEKKTQPVFSDSQRSRSEDRGRQQEDLPLAGRSSSAHSERNLSHVRSSYNQVSGGGNETSELSGPCVHQQYPSHPFDSGDDNQYETVIQYVPKSSSDAVVGGNQFFSEKETDSLSDYSSSSLAIDRPSSRVSTPQRPQLQHQERFSFGLSLNEILPGESGRSSENGSQGWNTEASVINPSAENTSRSGTLSPTRPHSITAQSPVVQRYREESVDIKIKRPKDFILQWEDTMDRLSGVSVTDEMGFPLPPLVSGYQVKVPSRSRSFDADRMGSSHTSRAQTSIHRSKSETSKVLGTVSQSARYGNRIQSPSPVTADNELESILNKLPDDLRDSAHKASKFFLQTRDPEVLALIDAIKAVRDNSHYNGLRSSNLSSHYDAGEQTSLKRAEHSSQSTGYRTQGLSQTSFNTPPSSSRFHSLSPRRRQVVPHGLSGDGERGSDVMLSVSPQRDRSRSLSPQIVSGQKVPETGSGLYKPVVVNRSPGSQESFSTRSVEDGTYYSSVHALYPESTSLRLESDWSRSYRMDSSPPPSRRAGSSRVPRREAWEQQRRLKESTSDGSTDVPGESRFIQLLGKEIEMLKQKVEMMEEGEARRSLSRSRRSSASRESDNEDQHTVYHPSSLTLACRERAASCPHLKVSSRSSAARPSARSTAESSSAEKLHCQDLVPRSPQYLLSADDSSLKTQSLRYKSPACVVGLEIWGEDLSVPGENQPERLAKWKQLITERNLTASEVIELKQALACAIVENDTLITRLSSARHEVHDKLAHTNSVLDDCRRHLAKSQVENMEFRSMLEHEKQRSAGLESRVKELEKNISEMTADNQHLENELDHTSHMLDKSLVVTLPGVEALKAENAHLISRLASVENENDFLREDFENMKHSQTKALTTVEELRECLDQVRKERQDLFDEVTSLQRREQAARVREIINSYQEKGAMDESEKERGLARFLHQDLTDPDEGIFSESQTSQDLQSHSASFRSGRSYFKKNTADSKPSVRERSVSPVSVTPQMRSSQQEYYSDDDLSPSRYREIYPHRRSYTPRSRSCSPSCNVPRNQHARFDPTFVDHTLHEIEQEILRERQTLLDSSDSRKIRFSSYHSDDQLNDKITRNVKSDLDLKNLTSGRTNGPLQVSRRRSSPQADHLNRSFSSMEDLHRKPSRSPSPYHSSPRPGILKGKDRFRAESTVPLRSPSPAYVKCAKRNLTPKRNSPERSQSPRYFPHGSTSLLSSTNQQNASSVTKGRPLHSKSAPGEIARGLQKEFEKEDQLLEALSRSTVLQNKSWFEMQRIISLFLKRIRKSTPILTEEQRRYADQLIQKYTGNPPS